MGNDKSKAQQQIPFGDDNKKGKRKGWFLRLCCGGATRRISAWAKSKGSHGGCLCFDAGFEVYAGEGWFSP